MFDHEVCITSPDGKTTVCAIPEMCLVTQFRVGDWDVLYRPTKTMNMGRAGIPLMIPCFGGLAEGTFKETNTKIESHGFGRRSTWTLAHKDSSSLRMELKDDEKTHQMYPFHFKFSVEVKVEQNKLIYSLTMENLEKDKELPVQPGLHPYFTCPFDKKCQVQVKGMDSFKATDFDWRTTTPNNNYPFSKEAAFAIPGLGECCIKEVPTSDDYAYKRLQVWSEPEGAKDYEFICFEPVVWGADGLNNPHTRLNIQPHSSRTIKLEFIAKAEDQ